MNELLTWGSAHASELFQWITSTMGIAALLAALTPSKWDNTVLDLLRKIIDILGANWLNAANKK